MPNAAIIIYFIYFNFQFDYFGSICFQKITDEIDLFTVQSVQVGEILKKQEAEKRIIAAICAAPNVLKAHGIAKGKKLTSYPSVKNDLINDYSYVDDDIVVIDGEWCNNNQQFLCIKI